MRSPRVLAGSAGLLVVLFHEAQSETSMHACLGLVQITAQLVRDALSAIDLAVL